MGLILLELDEFRLIIWFVSYGFLGIDKAKFSPACTFLSSNSLDCCISFCTMGLTISSSFPDSWDMISSIPRSICYWMNDLIITMGVFSSVLITTSIVVDVVPIEGVSSVVATRLVIKEICILDELSPHFEPFFFLVCWSISCIVVLPEHKCMD